jgi:TonB family protein
MKNRLLLVSILVVLFNFNCGKNNEKPMQEKTADFNLNNKKEKESKEMIDKITSTVDKLPEVIKQPSPVYPAEDQKAKVEGTIYLKLLIDKDGNAKKVDVIKREEGSENMEKSSIEAAFKTKFKPALRDGKPVECAVVIPYKFRLK